MEIKTKFVQNVKIMMVDVLNEEQMRRLDYILLKSLEDIDMSPKVRDIVLYDDTNDRILKEYIRSQQLNGLSMETLKQYYKINKNMLNDIGKNYKEIDCYDMKVYFAEISNRVQKVTYNNYIRYINNFFKWLIEEEYVDSNPMRKVKPIRIEKRVKKSLSDSQRNCLRDNAKSVRDKAIMEVLYSTGCRVSELYRMNRKDIKNNEIVVFGKGAKERVVLLNDSSLYYLNMYLEQRKDDNEALFVTERKPHNRLSKGGIQKMIRDLGKECDIEKVHPHRFRRTCATNGISKGMGVEKNAKIFRTLKY